MKHNASATMKSKTSQGRGKLTKRDTQIEVFTLKGDLTKNNTQENDEAYVKINVIAFKKSLKLLESNYSAR